MDMRKIVLLLIVWFIIEIIPLSKSRSDCEGINELKLPSVKELADKEIERIQEEKAKQELEKQREREKNKVSRSVPNGNTSMKSYMDYRKITSKSSAQYQLQQRDDVYTDEEGFRKLDDKYIIAVGTHYSDTVGDLLRIKLSEGNTFEAVVGDIKNNSHTDSTNRQHKVDGSVVEFIVDTKNMDKLCKKMGDMSYSSNNNLMGDIVSIEILGNINK